MKKLFFSFLITCMSCSLFANEYVLQLAAFDRTVDQSYFEGIQNVQVFKDYNGFYVYYIDGFSDKTTIENQLAEYKSMGFNAIVGNMTQWLQCKEKCGKVSTQYYDEVITPVETYDVTTTEKTYVPKEKYDYERVRTVLLDNDNYSLEIQGQQMTAYELRCYLNLRGVSNCRISFAYDGNGNMLKSTEGLVEVRIYDEARMTLDVEQEFKKIINRSNSIKYSTKATPAPSQILASGVQSEQ